MPFSCVFDSQSVSLHRAQVIAASDERHIRAALLQPCAVVTADASGTHDCNLHSILLVPPGSASCFETPASASSNAHGHGARPNKSHRRRLLLSAQETAYSGMPAARSASV